MNKNKQQSQLGIGHLLLIVFLIAMIGVIGIAAYQVGNQPSTTPTVGNSRESKLAA